MTLPAGRPYSESRMWLQCPIRVVQLKSRNGRLAQLARACGSHPQGHWFESSIAHFLLRREMPGATTVCSLPRTAGCDISAGTARGKLLDKSSLADYYPHRAPRNPDKGDNIVNPAAWSFRRYNSEEATINFNSMDNHCLPGGDFTRICPAAAGQVQAQRRCAAGVCQARAGG